MISQEKKILYLDSHILFVSCKPSQIKGLNSLDQLSIIKLILHTPHTLPYLDLLAKNVVTKQEILADFNKPKARCYWKIAFGF